MVCAAGLFGVNGEVFVDIGRPSAAILQSFPAEPVLLFSHPKLSGGIGCRPFLGSQPGRVLF